MNDRIINTTTTPWEPLREGTFHKFLARDDKRDLQVDLMKLEPNAMMPRHRHPDIEWVLVLEGAFSDEHGTYSKGDFFHNEKGSVHTATAGPEGAKLLVVWCGCVEKNS